MNDRQVAVGDIVRFVVDAEVATQSGSFDGYGNSYYVGEEVAAVVVRVWGVGPSAAVNLKVFIDGPGPDIWVTSVMGYQGDRPPVRTWHFPDVHDEA